VSDDEDGQSAGREQTADGEDSGPPRRVGDAWADDLSDCDPGRCARSEHAQRRRAAPGGKQAADERRRRDPDRTDGEAGDDASRSAARRSVDGDEPLCEGGSDCDRSGDDVFADAIDGDADAEVRDGPGDENGADEPDGGRLGHCESGSDPRERAGMMT